MGSSTKTHLPRTVIGLGGAIRSRTVEGSLIARVWGTARNARITSFAAAFILVAAGSMSASAVAAAGDFHLESTIAFTSTRDNLALNPNFGAEVYLVKPVKDGTWGLANPRRLTNDSFADAFANLSPDGKRIVFDTNRLTAPAVCDEVTYLNIDDLFIMNTDGTEQTLLTRGSSATWSPDGKTIAFHASASYHASGGVETECPLRPTDAGSPMKDSDIFAVNVDDVLEGVELPTNITNSPDWIDDDPDWSPNGQRIVFTRHPVTDDPLLSDQAEIFLMNPDGSDLAQLTFNAKEERAPAWSPDGSRIVFMCRTGVAAGAFDICVMNADGTGRTQLTADPAFEGTPTFSPDGEQIVFGRNVSGAQQLFIMNADGTEQTRLTSGTRTMPDGLNLLPHWGELRVKV
jgi:Tol biopolymer transport system component